MRRFDRLNAPQIIEDNWEDIGNTYTARRQANASYRYSWPQINGQRINHIAIPILSAQTEGHCSYCDKFPLLRGDESIDHFKPKTDSLHYMDVCKWENLYLACKHCQDSKDTSFHDLLLRPDELHYSFQHFFSYNFTAHIIEPNPAASDEDQQRAAWTIEIFDFNFPAVKTSRRHAFERYNTTILPHVDDFNYRFLFD